MLRRECATVGVGQFERAHLLECWRYDIRLGVAGDRRVNARRAGPHRARVAGRHFDVADTGSGGTYLRHFLLLEVTRRCERSAEIPVDLSRALVAPTRRDEIGLIQRGTRGPQATRSSKVSLDDGDQDLYRPAPRRPRDEMKPALSGIRRRRLWTAVQYT